jgi:hypothetical protein
MASTHYTPVKPVANVDGERADASDVNSVSNAVETAFETLEAVVAAIDNDISGQVAAADASASEASSYADAAAVSAGESSNSATLSLQYANRSNAQVFTPNTFDESHTLNATDSDSAVVRMDSADPLSVIVPPDIFTGNVLIPVIQAGAGAVTISAGVGVTLNTPSGRTLVLRAQGSGVTLHLINISGNIWDVVGDLTEA